MSSPQSIKSGMRSRTLPQVWCMTFRPKEWASSMYARKPGLKNRRHMSGLEIVAHHKDVESPLGRLEDAAIVFDKVGDDPFEHGVHDGGIHHHVIHDLLDAAQVHHRLELRSAIQTVSRIDDAS